MALTSFDNDVLEAGVTRPPAAFADAESLRVWCEKNSGAHAVPAVQLLAKRQRKEQASGRDHLHFSLKPERISLEYMSAVLSFVLYRFSRQETIYIGCKRDNLGVVPLVNDINADTGFDFVLQNVTKQLDEAPRFTEKLFTPNIIIGNSFAQGTGADIIVSCSENGKCTVDYAADKYDETFMKWLMACFIHVFDTADGNLNAGSFSLTTEIQKQELYHLSNGEERLQGAPPVLFRKFEENAAMHPAQLALVMEDKHLTYGELNGRANCIANLIDARIVGICLERSVEMVASIYGIQKAGAAYLPLEPALPKRRLHDIITTAGLRQIITSRELVHLFNDSNVELIIIEDIDWSKTTLVHNRHINAADLAYVIFTSGSTGKPKGVAITHEGLGNRIDWMQNAYKLQRHDRVLQKTPFSFDVSVWEFFWPLAYNATLVIAPPGLHKDPGGLSEYIDRHAVSVLHFVPSMLQVFLELHQQGANQCISKIFCSGEALTYHHIEECMRRLPNAELHNLYGPTEASIDVTSWNCYHLTDACTPPIGRPIQNMQCLVLDSNGQLCPIGVAGDLYLSGIGLARGYLNNEVLTNAAFMPNQFAAGRKHYETMYRTGDVARYLPGGELEYLGRSDDQVKIRGLRIELQEINHILENLAFVEQAVTLKVGEKLVAFVLPMGLRATDEDDFEAHLREKLAACLPDYMIPHHFLLVQEIPLTANGKINRNALVAAYKHAAANLQKQPTHAHPGVLQQIWAEVLGISPQNIDAQKSFMEHGGDSLTMLKVIAKCKEQNIPLTLKQFAAKPYLSVLGNAAPVHAGKVQQEQVSTEPFMLSPIQQWFFENNTANRNFVMHASYYIDENYSLPKLDSCFRKLLEKHASLRLRFTNISGVWFQQYRPVAEMDNLLSFKKEALDLNSCIDLALREINVENGPLLFVRLFEENARPVLFIGCHHLAMDAVSWQVLLSDVENFYA
jgi:amino acid adenylation domain-containing protein